MVHPATKVYKNHAKNQKHNLLSSGMNTVIQYVQWI